MDLHGEVFAVAAVVLFASAVAVGGTEQRAYRAGGTDDYHDADRWAEAVSATVAA